MSRDRTLLANLGFADADKQNSMHDSACSYIAQPDVSVRLVEALWPNTGKHLIELADWALKTSTRSEVPISKGFQQYKTTIGFIDVVVDASWSYKHRERGYGREPYTPSGVDAAFIKELRDIALAGEGPLDIDAVLTIEPALRRAWLEELRVWGWGSVQSGGSYERLGVEVKASAVSHGDVIRQVQLYREYTQDYPLTISAWVVVTVFEPSGAFVDALRGSNIRCFHLGDDFHMWMKKAAASKVRAIAL